MWRDVRGPDPGSRLGRSMPMETRAATALVKETLALRRALLPLFSRDGIDGAQLDAAAQRSLRSWDLFLTCDCCAIPLAARLRAGALLQRLPTDVQALIAQRETAELQRVLAARQSLKQVDRMSTELGIPFVVLKGGALVAEADRAPLDLGDVDVLISPDVALDVWRALLDGGWRLKSGGPMPAHPAQSDANHLPGLVSPTGGLAVELHTSMEYGAGAATVNAPPTRALKDFRSLFRLTGSFGVVTTLRHSVIKHPHRRGHLRDLLLLQDTLRESAENVGEIEREIESDRYARELQDMLQQAHALAAGEGVRDSGATARFVAWKYATCVHEQGVLGPLVPGWSGLNYLPLERPAVRRFAFRTQLRYAFAPVPVDSPFRPSAGRRSTRDPLARLAGAAEGMGARALRALYRTTLLVLLATVGWRIRHRIDEMIAQ
jgi:hypothetical protein